MIELILIIVAAWLIIQALKSGLVAAVAYGLLVLIMKLLIVAFWLAVAGLLIFGGLQGWALVGIGAVIWQLDKYKNRKLAQRTAK